MSDEIPELSYSDMFPPSSSGGKKKDEEDEKKDPTMQLVEDLMKMVEGESNDSQNSKGGPSLMSMAMKAFSAFQQLDASGEPSPEATNPDTATDPMAALDSGSSSDSLDSYESMADSYNNDNDLSADSSPGLDDASSMSMDM